MKYSQLREFVLLFKQPEQPHPSNNSKTTSVTKEHMNNVSNIFTKY